MNITLYSPTQAHKVLNDVWTKCKAELMAGHKFTLTLTKQKRSNDQNKLFHALISEVAKQAEHAGARWDVDSWKRFLVEKWAHETGRSTGKVAPSLDGQRVVQLGLQTRDFTKEDASEFTEWLLAWCAESGIETNFEK